MQVEHTPEPVSLAKQMSKRAKIAILGPGSLYWAELIQHFIHYAQDFQGCEVVLMDSDPDSLELLYTLGSKLFKHAEVAITLKRTTNQKAALSDADFVITTFSSGGLQARYLDEHLPLRHGLIGQETVGAGGFFCALRTIPVMAGIAATIEKVAPKAFLLNCATPNNIVTEALTLSSGIRVIGVCDSPLHEIQHIATAAGVGPLADHRLYHRTAGLNHGNWTTAVWREGLDVLPEIILWSEHVADQPMTLANYEQVMLAKLIASYKAIPAHAMHYYYFPELVLEFLLQKGTTQAEDLIQRLPALQYAYQEETHKDVPQLKPLLAGRKQGNFALDVLRSILHNTGEEWILNVQNRGAINFLAHDRVVELPCRVDAQGAIPLMQDDAGIGVEQRGLLALLAEYECATAHAALWGTRSDAIKALAANPLVMSYSKAEKIYQEMANAHAHYLPHHLLQS